MDDLIKGLQGISAGALLGWIVAFVAAGKVVVGHLEKYRTLRNQIDDYKEKIADDEDRISSLEDEVKAMKSDYEKMRDENQENFHHIDAKLDCLSTQIANILEYNKNRDKADLKDRIRVLYERYSAKGSITRTEKETLTDLISVYTASGGNSFVKEMVIPGIQQLKVTD